MPVLRALERDWMSLVTGLLWPDCDEVFCEFEPENDCSKLANAFCAAVRLPDCKALDRLCKLDCDGLAELRLYWRYGFTIDVTFIVVMAFSSKGRGARLIVIRSVGLLARA